MMRKFFNYLNVMVNESNVNFSSSRVQILKTVQIRPILYSPKPIRLQIFFCVSDKHKLSHGSEYNMANIFRVPHILPTYFTSLKASEIQAKYEKRGKYW